MENRFIENYVEQMRALFSYSLSLKISTASVK